MLSISAEIQWPIVLLQWIAGSPNELIAKFPYLCLLFYTPWFCIGLICSFFYMGHPRLFFIYFCLFKQTSIQFLQ